MSEKHPPPELEEPLSYTEKPQRGEYRPARRRWPWLLVLVLLAVGVYDFWRQRGTAPPAPSGTAAGARAGRGGGRTPVVAVKASRGDIGVYLTGLGSVVPLHTVTVRTQINGYLMSVLYKEFDMVQQGAALAEIDPRPYQVQLEQAQGNLARDQAFLDNARVDLQRYQTLLTHNAVPEQQVATQQALVKQDEGVVKVDQAAIDSAKLNLTYCHITAPISGRVGLRLVDPGNFVSTGDATGLVVITQLQPITAIFTIPEDQLPAVLQKWRAGQHLPVDALDRNKTKLASGYLSTLDNQIDPTTGTLKLRATFDNQKNELFPNQFVNARLLVEEKRGVTLIPTAAVQRNNQQTYVWLVKPDSTVTVQPVKLGTSEGDQTEVASGLKPGDTLVMTGVDRLLEGAQVTAHLDGGNTRGAK
ncbi:MAG TPA: MdtA/MuxA family multidrug efflux RND transporter periplasmic adaptor subunit [Terriglobia bacterium]|nr:MdtA/MuxA family multidrug efflux RND transporter periplasmic adaptor subunit [Terriglobia bacterium]